jgi:hypothetical protein
MKSSELSPYQVVMIGIKKDVSVGLKKFFLERGVEVTQVLVSNGSGVVTFKKEKDVEPVKVK